MTTKTIYRDVANAKIAGVAAGVADYFGWKVKFVRIGWVVATVFWPPVMIAAYVLMAWLLDPKPMPVSSNAAETFDRDLAAHLSQADRASSTARSRFSDVRERFGRLEKRLRDLEATVTSREFQIDRELRKST